MRPRACYVFVDLPPQQLPRRHFFNLQHLRWELVEELDQGGLRLAVLRLEVERLREKPLDAAKGLQLITVADALRQNKLERLPDYLVPAEREQQRKELAERREQQQIARREEFNEDFSESKKLVAQIKEKLGKYVIKHRKHAFVRQIVHNRRLEWVKKQHQNRYLQAQAEREKQTAARVELSIAKRRHQAARKLISGTLGELAPDDQQEAFEKIQESLEKRVEIKKRQREERRAKGEKKLQRWH